jgi:ribosomal protein S18 acetylase RimI-like enzyme
MIELRPAGFSDYTSIAKVHAESWRKNYRKILTDQFLDHGVEKDRLEFWHKRFSSPSPNQQVTVVITNENIVGFSCILLDHDPLYGTLLDNLHVLQEFQNSGIGKLLMNNCAGTILEKSNSPKMYLWVYEANQNARKVYEHLGGMHVHTVKKYIEDGTEAAVCRYAWKDVTYLV